MACTSDSIGTLFISWLSDFVNASLWQFITLVRQISLPLPLLLMGSMRLDICHTSWHLPPVLSVVLSQLYFTFPVLVASFFFKDFTVLFPQASYSTGFSLGILDTCCSFCWFVISVANSYWDFTQFGVVLLLGCTDGGCSVCP